MGEGHSGLDPDRVHDQVTVGGTGEQPNELGAHGDRSPGAKMTVEELLSDARDRRRIRRLVLVLVLTTILCTVAGVWYVERTLARSADSALAGTGIEDVDISFSGRDAVLSGELETLTSVPRLLEVVTELPGVRTVRSEIRLAPPPLPEPETAEPVDLPDPVLGIRFSESQVVLSGSLPSENSIDQALAAARAVFGFEGVINHLVAGGVSEPEWLEMLWAGAFGSDFEGDFTIDVSDGVIRLVGTVPTRSMMTRVESSLAEALAGRLTVQSRLEIDSSSAGGAGASGSCGSGVEKSVVSSDTLFGLGTSQLDDEGLESLEAILGVLETCSEIDMEIAAHTDSRGSVADNLALSQAQAEAVREYLVSRGIAPARLTATGYGEAVPVADNEDEEGRRDNRRVELIPRGDG